MKIRVDHSDFLGHCWSKLSRGIPVSPSLPASETV